MLTGEELLARDIPTTSEATPMSYVSPASGRQTLLVTLPDSGELTLAHDDSAEEGGDAAERGGYVIAYRLPEDIP